MFGGRTSKHWSPTSKHWSPKPRKWDFRGFNLWLKCRDTKTGRSSPFCHFLILNFTLSFWFFHFLLKGTVPKKYHLKTAQPSEKNDLFLNLAIFWLIFIKIQICTIVRYVWRSNLQTLISNLQTLISKTTEVSLPWF